METPTLNRFLRREEVERVTGLKRTAIRNMVENGEFPCPFKLNESGRAIAWDEHEVAKWQQSRKERARTEAA